MKKFIFLTTALALCACSQKVELISESGEGTLSVDITSEAGICLSAATKAEASTITVDLPASLTLAYSGTAAGTKTLSGANGSYSCSVSLAAGTYKLSAYNYASEAAALEANDGRGDAYYYGEAAEEVEVESAKKSTVSFEVEVKNALARVLAEGFEGTLYELSSATISCEEREIEYTAFTDEEDGWFADGSSLSVEISYSYNGKTYTKTVASAICAEAKCCYNFTLSPASSGVGEITVTVNNTLTLVEQGITLDPDEDEEE